MTLRLQVAYPFVEGARFDFDYYAGTHIPMVKKVFGATGMTEFAATKGVGGRPIEAPPPFFLVATLTFPDEAALRATLAVAEPVIADIANFTDVEPHFMIGTALEGA